MKKYTRSQVIRMLESMYCESVESDKGLSSSDCDRAVRQVIKDMDADINDKRKKPATKFRIEYGVTMPFRETHMFQEVQDETSVELLTEEALEFIHLHKQGLVKFELELVKEDR